MEQNLWDGQLGGGRPTPPTPPTPPPGYGPVQYHKKCIKYWLKLIEMSTTRYPFACYKMLKELDDNGRHTWASNVRILLSRYGFGHVWLNQGVGDPKIHKGILPENM